MSTYDDDDHDKKSIKKPPEKTKNRPESTLINTEIIRLPNGEECISKKTVLKKNQDTGNWEKETKLMPIPDSSGRYIYMDIISGKSWTDLLIPNDHFAACRNPWEDHDYRLVYLKKDGHVTELGNVLCSECYEKNKKKEKLKKWIGWIYQPEIY